jgi:opacity protein-like surface antigen
MLRRTSIGVFVLVLVMSFASSASAEKKNLFGTTDWSRPGWYVGGGFGAGWDFLEDLVEENFPEVEIGTGWSANARAGYRVNSWFATEVLYEGVYDLDLKVDEVKIGASTDLHSIMANFKFILPTWRMHPYLGLGFGAQYGKFDSNLNILDIERWDFVFRPALGLDSYVTENWLINLELAPSIRFADYGDIPSELTDNVTLTFSAGIQYRF